MDTATPKTKGPSPRRRIVVLRSSQKFLWIFGNAVQDITVEADVERLARELGNIGEIIHLAEQGPQIVAKLWLKTQIGLQEFAVCVELEGIKQSSSGLYLLEGGKKYTLVGDIVESHKEIAERSIFPPGSKRHNTVPPGVSINGASFVPA